MRIGWVCCVSECCRHDIHHHRRSQARKETFSLVGSSFLSCPALQKHHQSDPTMTPNSQAYTQHQHQQHKADTSRNKTIIADADAGCCHAMPWRFWEWGMHLLPSGNSRRFCLVNATHLHATHKQSAQARQAGRLAVHTRQAEVGGQATKTRRKTARKCWRPLRKEGPCVLARTQSALTRTHPSIRTLQAIRTRARREGSSARPWQGKWRA